MVIWLNKIVYLVQPEGSIRAVPSRLNERMNMNKRII
jgi:hypothetical protein